MLNASLYFIVAMIFIAGVVLYLWRTDSSVAAKTSSAEAEDEETSEPATLRPSINEVKCIGCGLCVDACPENVISLMNARAHVADYSLCLGHGACFQNCPFDAIILRAGMDKRGENIPHVYENFESLERGIFIAGELGGMGHMKNASKQAIQAVDNISRSLRDNHNADYDLVIVGAGTAGLSAALEAKKKNLRFIVLEQDTIEMSVANYPRKKVSGTVTLDLPLAGTVTIKNATKKQLREMWQDIFLKYRIPVQENCKVTSVIRLNNFFNIISADRQNYTTTFLLLTIGRRGSPRKLNIPGENLEKVSYSLSSPENISRKNILIAGSGNPAIQAAVLLSERNSITVVCPDDQPGRLTPLNLKSLEKAITRGRILIHYKSRLISIDEKSAVISAENGIIKLNNDLVYIFAGGELTSEFLERAGIRNARIPAEGVLCQ
ncbi:MAG TPA: NAD(P)-binding domain-containing protein [Bacteroidales bacterium]|nr:NAD(P)-binding domain-containing protein [Bacteroidales bacterium]